MKKLFSTVAAILLLGVNAAAPLQQVRAETNPGHIQCSEVQGLNLNSHNYYGSKRWASPICSYLHPLADGGWMRVQTELSRVDDYSIEYYNSDFRLKEQFDMPRMLPDFGAFYAASDGYYYVITGDSAGGLSTLGEPKFDIAKYTADWKLVKHVQTAGTDVVAAFEGGTVRCADNGKSLLIRTSHLMESGHQSNYTIELDMQDMNFIYDADGRGYASHSFNQFVMYDGEHTIKMDQGDAYPRSVILRKDYGSSVEMVTYSPLGDVDTSDMFIVNYTGVAVGGLARSSTHYLVAYNSIDQDNWYNLVTSGDSLGAESVRNVYVAAVPRDDLDSEKVQTVTITEYSEEDGSGSNPYLIPVADDRFLLIWSHGQQVCYEFLDGAGNVTGAQYAVAGELSDCEPVISGNRVYWYTWEDSVVRFYSIDLEQPEHAEVVERVSRHEFEPASEPDADGNAVDVCTKCGFTIPHDPQPTFLTGIRKLVPEGDRIHKQIINPDFEYLDAGDQFEIFVNNISLKTEFFPLEMVRGYDYLKRCEKVRRFQVKEFDEPAISFVLRIEPLFVASQDQTHRITARHSFEIQEIKEPNDTEDGSITLKCSGCGHVSTFAMNTLTGANGEAVTAVISDNPGQEPAVTVALTDPETGGPVIAEAGTDYSVAYVQDPEKDTSYAVIVAAKNSRKIKGSFVLPFTIPEMQEPAAGDADGDGQLTAQDAELLAEWLLSDPETVIPNPQAVDMNQDQKLNAVDLTLIKRTLIGQTDL